MSELRLLLLKIEDLRRQLNDLSQGRALTDPEILAASQELDKLLNEYYDLVAKKLDE